MKMIDQKELVLSFDGGIWPNPGGVPRFGWQIKNKEGVLLHEGKGSEPNSEVKTNNVAEYLGLIKGLSFLKENKWYGSIKIFSDSRLLVGQMTDSMAVNKPHLKELRNLARKILHEVAEEISIEWTPREKNKECDSLASGKPKKDS
jgi:ribonuclease HI